jgi:drug/metabolite transporter (DMT)-like permease
VSRRELPLMMLVAGLMAAAFLFMKIAVPALGPAVLADVRVLAAAALLATWSRLQGRRLDFGRGVVPYLVLGALNAAVPFTLTAWGELRLPSSLAAVLMATIPLFTAALSAALGRERLGPRRWAGLALGLAGVAVLSGWRPAGFDASIVPSLLAVLGAALAYAAGSVYARHAFVGVDRTAMTVGNFLAAGALLAPLALLTPPTAAPGALVLAAMAALIVLSTSLSFRLYFLLIERAGPTVATSIGFLIPVFGALWGALFLREALPPGMLVGAAAVLVGMHLVTSPNRLRDVAPALARRWAPALARRWLRRRLAGSA